MSRRLNERNADGWSDEEISFVESLVVAQVAAGGLAEAEAAGIAKYEARRMWAKAMMIDNERPEELDRDRRDRVCVTFGGDDGEVGFSEDPS